MGKVSRFVINHARLIISLVILVTLVMGYYATKIDIKPGIEDMFPDDNPTVVRFNQANDLFGGMTFAVIMLEDDNIIDTPTLQKIADLTKELEALEGVQEVVSLTNVKSIKGNIFGIEVSTLVEKIPENEAEEKALQERIANDDQYTGSIISKDFTATGIMVKFNQEIGDNAPTVEKMLSIAQKYESPEKFYYTGNPVVVNDAQHSMKTDIFRLLPFIIFIIILILWLSFRSISGILLPLSTVLISIIWTIGGMALLNKPLSIISVALPVLLVSVGSAYTIHIAARHQEELASGVTGKEAVLKTITNVGIAVLIAGTTTMAGFGSLLFSDLLIIKEFALGTAFGIGVALVISIFFVPAVYTYIPIKTTSTTTHTNKGFLNRFFDMVFTIVYRYNYLIIGLVIILALLSILAIPRLYPETGYLNYFHHNSSTRIAADLVDERFGGSATLNIIIKGDINDPELLLHMAAFQDEAAKIDGLNNPISMVTLLRATNKALNGDDPSMKVIPTSRQQIAQYLLLMNMSDQNTTKEYLTFDEKTTRIQFLMESLGGKRIQQILNKINQLILKHFNQQYEIEVTGMPVLTGEISKLVIKSQIQSIIASILLTLLITSVLLKSVRRGLFCCLTIILTVIVNFGVMGWFKIPLDIATTMIASIAVGIGVDYSIHIYTRFEEEKSKCGDQYLALGETIHSVGRANLYNALAVIAGFCVILLSSFPPLVNFGGLTAITMVVSFISAIFLLPSLILLSIKQDKKVRSKTTIDKILRRDPV